MLGGALQQVYWLGLGGGVGVSVPRPRQTGMLARPVSHVAEADPMLVATPGGAPVRRLLAAERSLRKRLRE